MFLLDTNVVSNLRRKKPDPALVAWLRSVPRASVFMTAATIAEIQCGICQVEDATIAARVQVWLDGMMQDGHPRVLSFDGNAALLLGRMWATPSLNSFIANDPRSKKKKSGADLTIAAAAIAEEMVMVTGNVQDFLEINVVFPLPGLFNPFDGRWLAEGRHVKPSRQ